jgi:hypothetical protein
MPGFPSPFNRGDNGDDGLFTDYDEFDPEQGPTPGAFLDGQDLLTGVDHTSFHRLSRGLFEERGVYDMTFGYNLARLNLDTRHPDAGYRYAVESGDDAVLRAEFTPTTPFCPQSDTLTKGSFRAWNGLCDRHEYDMVRVRVNEMHHRSEEINAALEGLESEFRETGTVQTGTAGEGQATGGPGCSDDSGTTSRGYSPDAPF